MKMESFGQSKRSEDSKLRLPEKMAESIWQEIESPKSEKVSPIKEGEVFSPELELKQILKASRAERPKLLGEYKEKLAYQKEGLAKMQEEIITEIRKNPDATLGHLFQWVRDYGDTHGLTEEQKSVARELLRAYEGKHKAVRVNRDKYPDDKELFKAVFGQESKGQVEIIEGPITLYIRCKDIKDYAMIGSRAFLTRREATDQEVEHLGKSAGFSTDSSLIPELVGTIIVENNSKERKDYKKVLDHEEQHAIKKLFKEKLQVRDGLERLVDSATKTEGERIEALQDWLRLQRIDIADVRAKDEILAYFIGQNYPADKVVEILTTPKMTDEVRGEIKKLEEQKEKISSFLVSATLSEIDEINEKIEKLKRENSGLYDYLSDEKKNAVVTPLSIFGPEFKDIAEREIKNIFVKEYKDIIEKGTLAVEALSWAGYSEQQVMALLVQEPLAKWDKVSKRLIEEKKKAEK